MINRILTIMTILVLTTSCLNQGETPTIPGVDGPHINVVNGKILFSLGLDNVNLPIGINMPLSNNLEDASITIGPNMESEGSMLQIAFKPENLDTDFFEVVPSNTLPNGDAFPFNLDGLLSAHAFYIEEALNTTVYASKKLFGFYMPINFSDVVIFDAYYPLTIGGKKIGHFTLVGNNENGEGSGIIVMVSIEQLLANKDITTALKYSKRRKFKNRVF